MSEPPEFPVKRIIDVPDFIETLLSYDDCEVAETDEHYFISTSDAERVKRVFHQHGMSFFIRSSDSHLKRGEGSSARIMWSCKGIDFCGKPYYILKTTDLECVNGKRMSQKTNARNSEVDQQPEKKLRPNQYSKKIDCPATMKIREVVMYPEFALDPKLVKNRDRNMRQMMKRLHKKLETSAETVKTEKRFYITVSKPAYHNHSVASSFQAQTLDPVLRILLKKYIEGGITDVPSLKTLLEEYVKDHVGENIPNECRALFPTSEVIYNYVRKYRPADYVKPTRPRKYPCPKRKEKEFGSFVDPTSYEGYSDEELFDDYEQTSAQSTSSIIPSSGNVTNTYRVIYTRDSQPSKSPTVNSVTEQDLDKRPILDKLSLLRETAEEVVSLTYENLPEEDLSTVQDYLSAAIAVMKQSLSRERSST